MLVICECEVRMEIVRILFEDPRLIDGINSCQVESLVDLGICEESFNSILGRNQSYLTTNLHKTHLAIIRMFPQLLNSGH
jgi:hypothetical protein